MHNMTQPKLYTRGNTLWVRFSLDGEVIRKSLNLKSTKANKKLANTQIIPQLILKVNRGEFFENETVKVPTLDEFSKISFEIHKNNRREITHKKYLRSYEIHIQPHFGKRKIDKIKASDIARWQNKLLETRTSKTLKPIRALFRTIIDDAIRDEILIKNPFDLVRLPQKGTKREKNPFSIDEIKLILSKMPKNIKAFFAIGFYTGMRTGEIIGLKWSDIDFNELTINVQRSIRQGIESLPKTESSIREIEIIDVLLPYLKMHREIHPKSTYVFETYLGNPFTTSDKISSHYWRPLLEKLNIPYRNLYQMRHTFASMMISHGEDILWVSNMLGHKDSSVTLENYARFIKANKKQRATFLL